MRAGWLRLCAFAAITIAASPAEWRGRSIYQVMTDRFARTDGSLNATCNVQDLLYCGGTWQGILDKLDYIQGMGFSAIWISPITQQIPAGDSNIGDPYHGYWQNDIDQLNPYFGTGGDLQNLAVAVHEKNMYLMLDVVVNHFAWNSSENAVDYSSYQPFNDSSYFHQFCQIIEQDYSENQTALEQCWLGDSTCELPDLNTEDSSVIDTWNSWIYNTISTYNFDGLRVDTVKHIRQDFWPGFNSASGVYNMGEVADGEISFTCPYQEYMDGLINYPLYYSALQFFQSSSGNVTALQNSINGLKYGCKDSTLLAPFSENQDVARFPSMSGADLSRNKNMIAFSMLADGIPVVYQGQEQFYDGGSDPYNRAALWFSNYSTTSEFYLFVTQVNNLRNHAIAVNATYLDYQQWPVYTDANTIGTRKGFDGNQIVALFSNLGAGGSSSGTVGNACFAAAEAIVDVLSCQTLTADDDGSVAFQMDGDPKILYPEANLQGSGICGM